MELFHVCVASCLLELSISFLYSELRCQAVIELINVFIVMFVLWNKIQQCFLNRDSTRIYFQFNIFWREKSAVHWDSLYSHNQKHRFKTKGCCWILVILLPTVTNIFIVDFHTLAGGMYDKTSYIPLEWSQKPRNPRWEPTLDISKYQLNGHEEWSKWRMLKCPLGQPYAWSSLVNLSKQICISEEVELADLQA